MGVGVGVPSTLLLLVSLGLWAALACVYSVRVFLAERARSGKSCGDGGEDKARVTVRRQVYQQPLRAFEVGRRFEREVNRVCLFDTTLRDGGQTRGVDFSVADKVSIATALDEFGVDYIEGGWPGANPTDTLFFSGAPKSLQLQRAKLVAFGMTRRAASRAAEDAALTEVLRAPTDATCIFGKSWDFQVEAVFLQPQTLNPKPQTLNPKPQTLNP